MNSIFLPPLPRYWDYRHALLGNLENPILYQCLILTSKSQFHDVDISFLLHAYGNHGEAKWPVPVTGCEPPGFLKCTEYRATLADGSLF